MGGGGGRWWGRRGWGREETGRGEGRVKEGAMRRQWEGIYRERGVADPEQAARRLLRLPEGAYLDMGDFVGGMLKYIRRHPVKRITIAGGFAKMSKLAAGRLDLHSARAEVDLGFLSGLAAKAGADGGTIQAINEASTGNVALAIARLAKIPLADMVAERARECAKAVLATGAIEVHILIIDRQGDVVGQI